MELYDVAIIGGGPAGMTASVYTSRSNLKTVFIEKGAPGGKMVYTAKIENWSGYTFIQGADLALKMFEHAQAFGGKYQYGDVSKIEDGDVKTIIMTDGTKLQAKAVIIATGMKDTVPDDIKGIDQYEHKGVSYCATCDGPLYKGQDVAIIGGGNSAIEEASYLSSVAGKVYVFVRNKMRAEAKVIEELRAKENVEIKLGAKITEIKGDGEVQKIAVNDNGKEYELDCSAIFPYIGAKPNTSFVSEFDIFNENGYIKVDEHMETKVKNIFAAGDVIDKAVRQIGTAVNDGIIAAKKIIERIG